MRKLILTLPMLVTFNLFSQQGTSPMSGNYAPVLNSPPVVENRFYPNVTRYYVSDDGSFTAMIEPNIRIFPTGSDQTDPHVTVWSANSNYVFVSSMTRLPMPIGVGYYSTTNGGTNWFGSDSLPIPVSGQYAIYHTSCYSHTGTLFYNYETYDFSTYRMFNDRSTNYGTSWAGRVLCPTTGYLDPEHMAIDVIPSSPFYGRIYVVVAYWFVPYTTSLTYSTDNGLNFTPQQLIGAPISGQFENGPHVATDRNGTVYTVWHDAISNSPYTETSIAFTKSTNGGVNWTTPTRIHNIGGIRGYYLSSSIRGFSHLGFAIDRTGGARNNWLYIVWPQINLAPAGSDPDICFSRSTNGGLNWSAPVRVNNDAINNTRVQFMPGIAVDQVTGNLAISFFDTRDVVSGNDSVNTYIAVSNNGGDTWQNIRVSNVSHRPLGITGWSSGWYSLHTAVAMNNNVIRVFWPDNRSGPVQIYTSTINITGSRKLTEQAPETYQLFQNYPNPFNPVTIISFDLPKSSHAKLSIYDVLGREVAVLVNEQLKPGTYEYDWDAINFSSGVYFYRITAGEFNETRKMTFVK